MTLFYNDIVMGDIVMFPVNYNPKVRTLRFPVSANNRVMPPCLMCAGDIRKHYMGSWFLIDLATVLPFDQVSHSPPASSTIPVASVNQTEEAAEQFALSRTLSFSLSLPLPLLLSLFPPSPPSTIRA